MGEMLGASSRHHGKMEVGAKQGKEKMTVTLMEEKQRGWIKQLRIIGGEER